MKNLIAAYIFIILYGFAMLRPVLPLIEYYANYDYIAEQLCENRDRPFLECNGKCYVAKEIQKTLPDSPIDSNSKLPKIDFTKYPVTPLDTFAYHLFSMDYNQKKGETFNSLKPQEYSSFLLRPPKV